MSGREQWPHRFEPTARPVGIGIGLLGVMLMIYWVLAARRDVMDDEAEIESVTEGVGERFGAFVLATISVLITIGDQLIALVADLAGMIDSPVVVGHMVGGALGWLGVQGTLGPEQFLIGFGIVTLIALVWRATTTRGRGI